MGTFIRVLMRANSLHLDLRRAYKSASKKHFTFGGFGVWYIVDIVILLMGKMRDADGGLVARPF